MIIILDYESTGIDTKVARVTEIGAMVVDMSFNPVGPYVSHLVWGSNYPAITPEVEMVTGINQLLLDKESVVPDVAFKELGNLLTDDVQFILAYNREYDQSLFMAEMERHQFFADPRLKKMAAMPWICGMVDVETNYTKKCWKLSHLALDYGVTVDPSILHRAINDVELTRQMLVAAKADPLEMYQYQLSPWIFVRAKVAKPWTDGGESSGRAKALGYSWEKAKGDNTKVFEKTWVKRIKEKDWEATRKSAEQALIQVEVI